MYYAQDPAYKQTRAIKTGKFQLDPVSLQLIQTIAGISDSNVINFHCYKVISSATYCQQHVILIVETIADKKKLGKVKEDPAIRRSIADYIDSPHRSLKDPVRNDIFEKTTSGYPDLIIEISALEEIEMRIAYSKASKDIVKLQERYESIWIISVNELWHTIFYYTTQQLSDNELNGIGPSIRSEILNLLLQHDAFSYGGPHWLEYIRFDSKEHLDTEYQGNMYYYYK